MRIISGSAKGRKLAEFPGRAIRPTPDRVREAVFSMLFSRIGDLAGRTVLDLFAGTGAMGIEALSRGCQEAWFVDKDRRSVDVIHTNLKSCQLADRGRVLVADVPRWLAQLPSGPGFDLVFLDPPYAEDLADQVLRLLCDRPGVLADRATVVAETGSDEQLHASYGNLVRVDQRRYGKTAIHLYSSVVQNEGQT